ncbi:hypothetical protein LZ30DRAFT_799281 [Colletotrichum cereale]|nr:hypothetical protein LZ30DRAFT_799281 [Colletotrichum cereale]
MLPIQLLGTYRQYKQDTDSVALWLASTAKACDYPEPLTGLERQAPKSGRLKGKQRTKAGGGGKAKTGPKPEPAGRKTTKHAIAIKDFLPLANFIANRRDPAVSWIWSNHREGVFDLAAAAVATNTAISIARGLIEDVAPLLDTQDGGAWGVVNQFYLITCLQKGYEVDQVYVANRKDNFNYDLYDLADECYAVAFRLLQSFADVLDPRDLPLIKEGMFGTYDPNSHRPSKTGREKFQEDQILLMEFFTELITVIRLIPDYPVEDEFLREMRRFDKTPVVSFALVFAAQVFLDIHHTMRASTRQGFMAVVKETTIMSNSLARHLEFHKNLRIKNWPASNDQGLRELRRLMEWMGEDPVHGAKAKVYRRVGMPVPSEMEAHRIMIYSPILSGLYLFRLRTEIYDVGLAVANAWGSITYTAHLYNALFRERLVEGQWRDMDLLLTLVGDSSVWVGDERPKTTGDCFQKFCLQMGISAAAFTTNRRRKTAVASRAGPRGIKEGAPVSSRFKAQVCSGADVEWTPELLDDVVARSAYERELTGDDNDLTMAQIDDPQELRARDRLRQQRARDRAAGKVEAAGGLVPDELAATLVLALNAESLEMAFPYLVMHRHCWGFLRSVREVCDPVLRELYTPAYMDKESELPWVVGYILMAASGVDGPRDPRLLNLAAEPCNAIVGSEAGELAIAVARMIGKDVEFKEEEEEEEEEE